jgi:hypothetical protein
VKLVIAVKKDEMPTRRYGTLISVTPIEVRIAMVRALRRDTDSGDEGKLQRWVTYLLSAPFEYWVLDGPDAIWKAARQQRENITKNYETMRLSPMQQMYEFIYFKNKHESTHGPTSAKKLATEYRADIHFAESTEEVSDYYVEQVCAIDRKILSDEKAARILLAAENAFNINTPFDSIQKMYAIQSKAKTPELIYWNIRHIYDQWFARNPSTRCEKISLRWLKGETPNMGGKGLVDLNNHKFHQKVYMLTEWIDGYAGWGPEVRAAMRKVLDNHDDYRQFCGFPGTQVDLTWRAGWPPSAEDAFQFMEEPIHMTDALAESLQTAISRH